MQRRLHLAVADALGSAVALTDGSGNVLTTYTYEPFGATTTTGAVSSNPYDFTGREDDATGLKYYRARYYHPNRQRFISEDPIGLGTGEANLYAYVRNDPVALADPTGLCDDPGGPGLRYCIDRFITERTALGLLGDDRGATPTGANRYRMRISVSGNEADAAWVIRSR